MKTFDLPAAPTGHYFQIKHGMMDSLKNSPDWRVVLMRRVWGILPVEVSGARLHDLTQEAVTRASDQAREGYFTRRRLVELNRVRKDTNFLQRRRSGK